GLILYLVCNLLLNTLLQSWSEQKLEQVMTNAMDRKVELGHVRWSLGWRGIGFHTDKINITGRDGKPFLFAGDSSISVALFPLLKRNVIVKDVDLQHPVFYAKKLTPSLWNFSDLPERAELQHINHLSIHDGTVHLSEISISHRAAYETIVRTIDGAVDRPFGMHVWKFGVSFTVPHTGYSSTLSLNGIGSGPFRNWLNNRYHFSLRAKNINQPDFISVSDRLAYVQ
ncbi:MAG: hypothetical protein ACRD3W_31970, partial [Terriglobales bacterium]